jgi:hypothetical protein
MKGDRGVKHPTSPSERGEMQNEELKMKNGGNIMKDEPSRWVAAR